MATATPLDQVAALAGTFGRTFDIVMPEKRPYDAITLAHVRAADWVQYIASWLWHGSDLSVVVKRTPFTAATAQDLWRYYESLPLDQRVDKLVVFFIGVELMQSCGILTREQFPRLRRMIDVYAGALATTCLMPRRVFYYVHRSIWSLQSSVATREVREPAAPLPLSRETEEAVGRAVDSAMALIGGPTWAGPSAGVSSSGGGGTSWTTIVLATSVGVGAVVYWVGLEDLERARRTVADRWQHFQRSIGIKPRFLQQ